MDDLAREPFAPQVVVEGELERHRMRALALQLVAVERRHRQHQVVAAQLMVVAVERDADAAALAQRRADVRRVERRDRNGHLRHPLAESRPERAVVGLDLIGAELVGGLDEAQLLDVELVAHDVGQALDALPLATDGHDDRLLERLAQLDLRRRARREA